MIPDHVRERTLLFNSFFFHKLTSKATPLESDVSRDTHLQKVKKWLRGDDIFSKDYLIVPVNRSKHWFLLIVCNHSRVPDANGPSNAVSLEVEKRPCILLMDSLGAVRSGGRNKLTDPLRKLLKAEWTERGGPQKNFLLTDIPDRRVQVTEQDNYYDCGLYLLQYVELFLKDPVAVLSSETNDFKRWIDRRIMHDKRSKIREVILDSEKTAPKGPSQESDIEEQID